MSLPAVGLSLMWLLSWFGEARPDSRAGVTFDGSRFLNAVSRALQHAPQHGNAAAPASEGPEDGPPKRRRVRSKMTLESYPINN